MDKPRPRFIKKHSEVIPTSIERSRRVQALTKSLALSKEALVEEVRLRPRWSGVLD